MGPGRLLLLAALAGAVAAEREAAAPDTSGLSPAAELEENPALGPEGDLTNGKKASTVRIEPPPDLPPQVEGWKGKAVRAYAQAQDRKWRNWVEAMFEPK